MKNNLILTGIVGIALILRLFAIGEVPASPDWDEVSLGYNAYSILHTGRDEYGSWFPLIFRSFDDYKPGLYVYLALPFIALGGLSVPMVRLPSVIIGTLAVASVYFLVRELLKDRTHKTYETDSIAAIAAGLMALSPWHIQFSRVAFEASVGMAFTIFGTLFFLKGLKKPLFFILTAVFFGLAVHVYQSEKVFIPLLSLVLAGVYAKQLLKQRAHLIVPALIFIIIAGPFYYQTLTNPDALMRARGVSLFADQTPFLEKSVSRLIYDREQHDYLGLVFDNRRIAYLIGFVRGYISHFDVNWLFITGDEARHNPPNFGHLYLIELPFLLLGLFHLLTGNYSPKSKWLLVLWILVTPIPASITSGTPHPIRTIHFLPGLHIISSVGLVWFLKWVRTMKWAPFYRAGVLIAIGLIGVINIGYYLDQYFVQYNYRSSDAWQYGYKEAISYVMAHEHEYDRIVVSSEQPMDQSYMFFLFYTKYDPRLYLEHGGTKSGGFAQENAFGKYVFRPIDWEYEQSGATLYVGRPQDIKGTPLKTISFLNGDPAIVISVK